jgi:hypothetical protein
MIPNPLLAAVVHFPFVLMVILPIVATIALWTIRRGAVARKAWVVPLATAAALTLSGWVAVETGEREEEKVEAVVAESALHRHEEAAERFLLLSGVLLVLTSAGLLAGPAGRVARVGATLGALGLAAVGAQVGHSGGELVYRDGAASAYTGEAAASASAAGESGAEDD